MANLQCIQIISKIGTVAFLEQSGNMFATVKEMFSNFRYTVDRQVVFVDILLDLYDIVVVISEAVA